MLGKTAGSLYWMARYLERSENNARLIDAGFRIALTRSNTAEAEWRSVLVTAGQDSRFRQAHGEDYSSQRVVDFMLRDPANPSSILSVIKQARDNARTARTYLTREVWEAVKELAARGTTVLLTTQYLDEAEQLADRIAILHEGRIIANGTLGDLKKLLPPAEVEYVEKQPSLEDVFLAIVGPKATTETEEAR